jgi:glycine betaine/choline ABC-type transport system substrate-binding protein
MDLSLIYRALADRQVDLVAGDATSGLIEAYGLAMLKDDRRYFPPYDAVPVARRAMLLAYPEVRHALAALAGRVSLEDMRRMNKAVDADRMDPAAVVRALLRARSRP